MSYGIHTYQRAHKTVVSPITHVLALYKDVTDALQCAYDAIQSNQLEERYLATRKASQILEGLEDSLFRGTPESLDMAQTFDQFYAMIRQLILKVNVYNDEKSCQDAIEYMSNMRRTLEDAALQHYQEDK